MALQDPIRERSRIVLSKIEATYGTDPAPGGTDAILATNFRPSLMNGTDVSRELDLPYLGAQATIPAELHRSYSFSVELAPSGIAGTPPAWGPLLRACGVAETIVAGTSVTYNPVSDGHESATFYFWSGNTLFKSSGSRGTAKLMWTAQQVPKIEFTFQGLLGTAAEAARATPDLTAFQKPRLATHASTPIFKIAATDLVMRSFSLDLGNQVENRFLIGRESVLITDRADAIETTVEAVPLTYLDPFDLAAAQTTSTVKLVHGATAGAIATLDVQAAQMQRPGDPSANQGVVEWPLKMVPLPVSGNDQWTLTFT